MSSEKRLMWLATNHALWVAGHLPRGWTTGMVSNLLWQTCRKARSTHIFWTGFLNSGWGGVFYILSSLSPVQKPKLESTATLATATMFQVLPRRHDFLGWQLEMSSGRTALSRTLISFGPGWRLQRQWELQGPDSEGALQLARLGTDGSDSSCGVHTSWGQTQPDLPKDTSPVVA